MGIPFYFSSIIQQYPHIIQKLIYVNHSTSKPIDNFFIDANSICYDCARKLDYSVVFSVNTHQKLIQAIIAQLEEYISIISPTNIIMIALDGTPPVAKLQQQRERRYKSWYSSEMIQFDNDNDYNNDYNNDNAKKNKDKKKIDPFNTIEITTGTPFMHSLNQALKSHFSKTSTISKFKVNDIIVSASDVAGEGEAKIFDFIRNDTLITPESKNVVYGLDADLIMLAINHLPIRPDIHLFRETPEFIKSIDSSLEPNENYILDIPELCKSIMVNMQNVDNVSEHPVNRVYDYIFLCFFLGNDFMPHFPSINIRTGGIDKLLNAYKATISGSTNVLTDGKIIYWRNVRKLVSWLAEREEEYIQNEMNLRNKRENMYYPTKTLEEKRRKIDAIPTYERELEKYIDPFKDKWKERYYEALFHIHNINEDHKKDICHNYLEGLEWTFKYYTHSCPDWRWYYKYHYPPLLVDLIKYIPYFDTQFVKIKEKAPITEIMQLCYVLPRPHLKLLPTHIYNKLIEKHIEWYGRDYDFIWAFCKYFWEAHVVLPPIDLDELEHVI